MRLIREHAATTSESAASYTVTQMRRGNGETAGLQATVSGQDMHIRPRRIGLPLQTDRITKASHVFAFQRPSMHVSKQVQLAARVCRRIG